MTNGSSLSHSNSRPELSQRRTDTINTTRSAESGYLAPVRVNALSRKDSSISETGSAPDSLLDLYGPNRSGINSVDYGNQQVGADVYADEDPEHSRWIHRDKLARIESRELQAAGIILPRARATSKSSRRDHSREQQGNGVRSEQGQKRQRIESVPTEEEEVDDAKGWDLRLPEEAAEDQGDIYRDLNGKQGVSRIPVCKTSPVPIPIQHLERDTPMKRKLSGAWTGEEEAISYPKSRTQTSKSLEEALPSPTKRVVSDVSPTKKPPARKGSVAGSRAVSGSQRLKGKGGSNQSTPQRPPTRSSDIGANSAKRPEGDPPWLSAFKPDPRLPPDQQLLPTVAKRLQQEQWEKEGKTGMAYDTSFRPLNDEEYQQPEPKSQAEEVTEKAERDPEWPLRGPKSPTLSTGRPGTAGTGGYSTMPKITPHQGAPQGLGPIPSPKPPVRLPQSQEETKKGGCGCCLVM